MRRRSAAVATAVGGGGGERRRTKTTTAVAIAPAMVEEAVVAMVATVATVAEATAVETERQNSGAGILSLADVVCRTVLLGKQWRYFGIFFSVCMRKQILFARQIQILRDTCICIFRLRKYDLQIQKWSFCKFICASGQKKFTLFGKNDSRIVSAAQKKMVQKQTPSSVKRIGVKNHSLNTHVL
jgi:hypothetical protein